MTFGAPARRRRVPAHRRDSTRVFAGGLSTRGSDGVLGLEIGGWITYALSWGGLAANAVLASGPTDGVPHGH